MAGAPPELFAFLQRAFSFTRRITCRLTATESLATGTATFAPLAPAPGAQHALLQSEEGALALAAAAAPITVRASYTWHWAPGAAAAAVRFPDGRAFVDGVDFLVAPCHVRHACAPDDYEGVFARAGDAGFSISWTVVGPRKDYTSVTHFAPL